MTSRLSMMLRIAWELYILAWRCASIYDGGNDCGGGLFVRFVAGIFLVYVSLGIGCSIAALIVPHLTPAMIQILYVELGAALGAATSVALNRLVPWIRQLPASMRASAALKSKIRDNARELRTVRTLW